MRSHPRTHPPEFRKEFDLQHALEVADSRRAACATLEADDALDRRDVVETPASEIVLEVDQLFRELVEVPVVGWISVDLGPCAYQGFAFDMRLGRRSSLRGLTYVETPSALQQNRLLIEARLGEDCGEICNDLRAVIVWPQHREVAISGKELNRAVLPGLKSRGLAEPVAKLGIVARGHGA